MQDTGAYADFSIKARCVAPQQIEDKLQELNAQFIGEDFQTDTFYEVALGKLKLRAGQLENLLTHYQREPYGGKMKTKVFLYEKNPAEALVNQYTQSRKVIGKVVKRRKIYWINNVKFHVDRFEDGKSFVEIEAMDMDGSLGTDTIREQVESYMKLLSIKEEDILGLSYIDML